VLRALFTEPLALQSREELVRGAVVSGVGSSGSFKEWVMALIGELVNLVSCA